MVAISLKDRLWWRSNGATNNPWTIKVNGEDRIEQLLEATKW